MTEHMKLCDIPQICGEAEKWLKERYGEEEGTKLWEATSRQYNKYLEELPDYGGKRPVMRLQSTAASLFSPCTRCFRTIRL